LQCLLILSEFWCRARESRSPGRSISHVFVFCVTE
jgi:hypothetical protein